jgi:dTMP kinase
LQAGKIVLCDRFIDSSLAYQGFARGLGMDEILKINQFAIDECMPNLTLFFDVAPETGLARIHRNENREVNRLDLEKKDFHQKVREGYLQLAQSYSERIKVINAEQSLEQVVEDTLKIINKFGGIGNAQTRHR